MKRWLMVAYVGLLAGVLHTACTKTEPPPATTGDTTAPRSDTAEAPMDQSGRADTEPGQPDTGTAGSGQAQPEAEKKAE